MIKSIKLTVIGLLLILCSWMTYHAFKIALADISHYPVKHFLEKLKPTELPKISTLSKQLTKIQYSIDLRPKNAQYLEYLARLHYLMALQQQKIPTKSYLLISEKNLRQALNAHVKATQLRPKWPYSWANIALVKSHLQEFDQQYTDAIDQAIATGSWEIASNNAISQAGFNGWDTLNDNFKLKTVRALERVYQQRKSTAIEIANYYQRANEICSLLLNEGFRKRVCNK